VGRSRDEGALLGVAHGWRGTMVISPIHLTPLLAKLDGMAQRVKKFRTMAHRCEKLF
jgi:hypothetical protein